MRSGQKTATVPARGKRDIQPQSIAVPLHSQDPVLHPMPKLYGSGAQGPTIFVGLSTRVSHRESSCCKASKTSRVHHHDLRHEITIRKPTSAELDFDGTTTRVVLWLLPPRLTRQLNRPRRSRRSRPSSHSYGYGFGRLRVHCKIPPVRSSTPPSDAGVAPL